MGPLEHPAVKEGLTAILASLKEQQAALEGIHATAYGKGLKAEDVVEPDGDEGAMKAFLAQGASQQYQLLGIGSRLKSLSLASNLTKEQRRIAREMNDHLARLVTQAKSLKPELTKPVEDESAKAALIKRLDELMAKLPA